MAIALAGNGGARSAPGGSPRGRAGRGVVAGATVAEPSTGAGGTGGGRPPENKAARAKTAGRVANGTGPPTPAGKGDASEGPRRIGGGDAVVVDGGGRAGDGVAGRASVVDGEPSGRGRLRVKRWRSNGDGLETTTAGGVERAEAEGEGEPLAVRRRMRRAAERAGGGKRRSAALAAERAARAAARDSAADTAGHRVTVGTMGSTAARASRRRRSSTRLRFFRGGVGLGEWYTAPSSA